ncbi:MAG: M14 family metallopeptidase [Planctomycetota bacterium]
MTLTALLVATAAAIAQPSSVELFEDASFDQTITPPDAILGFPLGDRPADHATIERCLVTWAEESDRAALVEYGQTHEGRTLYTLFISSEDNIDRLDEIQADWLELWDSRSIAPRSADRLLADTPAIAWFAYAIHGNELSGADAALAFAYELIASDSPQHAEAREGVVIAVDPLMNPDGRDRAVQAIREAKGPVPTYDDQSRLHAGHWPSGRTNHYVLDLNRDWILATAPETQGRIELLREWNPLLFIDAHEMGAQDTYLFSPPREPINQHVPSFSREWGDRFADDQAAAFDRRGWSYYTGEWLDNWYPGYSDAWSVLRGAIGILYEQAGVHTFGVRHPSGRVTTYAKSVLQQLESSRANLGTLVNSIDEIKADWLEMRREIVSDEGPYSSTMFALPATDETGRLSRLIDNLLLQGIEVRRSRQPLLADATDGLGRLHSSHTFPAGTYFVDTQQPTGPLASAMLELDPRMKPEFIAEEREALIRKGRTEIYDVTGWSLPLLHGLDAYQLDSRFAKSFPLISPADLAPGVGPGVRPGDASQGWVVDGAHDSTPSLAAHLMHEGVRVRFARKVFEWGGRSFARGSLLIAHRDQVAADVSSILDRESREAGLAAYPTSTGLGPGEVADIGGEYFPLLQRPRIAVIGQGRVSPTSYGAIWHTLEERYRLAVSYIPADGFVDLRRYNVLVVPPGGSGAFSQRELREWVSAGGTLIATESAVFAFADEDGLSSARRLRDVLDDLDTYETEVLRELSAQDEDPDAAWGRVVDDAPAVYPWSGIDLTRPGLDTLERQDEWERQFMPAGTVLAARTDQEHWLTAGHGELLPVLASGRSVLMAARPVEVPVRFGAVEHDNSEGVADVGWSRMPEGTSLRLRMSGLLWPEAARRLANAAAVTRESVGRGQIILFAMDPVWRGGAPGTERVFMNAVVYGPGLGASHPIMP